MKNQENKYFQRWSKNQAYSLENIQKKFRTYKFNIYILNHVFFLIPNEKNVLKIQHWYFLHKKGTQISKNELGLKIYSQPQPPKICDSPVPSDPRNSTLFNNSDLSTLLQTSENNEIKQKPKLSEFHISPIKNNKNTEIPNNNTSHICDVFFIKTC